MNHRNIITGESCGGIAIAEILFLNSTNISNYDKIYVRKKQ